jgi:hypothetical protein
MRYIITQKNALEKGITVTWVWHPVWDGPIEDYKNDSRYKVVCELDGGLLLDPDLGRHGELKPNIDE